MATRAKPRLNKDALFEDLGYKPHPGQKTVHDSLAPRRVVACGVRWGKTVCAAMEGIAAALEPRKRSCGWVVAPTYDLADKVFRELVILAAEHLRHRIITLKESERKLVLRNLAGGISELRGKSADNPVSLLGEGLDWVIVDEASRLKPTIWEGHLSQRLVDKKGWALLISTPKGKGTFYELFRRGRRDEDADYESWNHPSWTNPHLDRELIEAERDRLPQRVYDQEYGAQFIEGAGQVFRGVREAATLDAWQAPLRGQAYFAGLDLARVADYTVLVVLNERREVVFFDRFTRLDWTIQLGRIRETLARFNDAQVFVDSTGAGEPILEALLGADCNARPYLFSNRSKAQLIDNLALLLERREIKLPTPKLCPVLTDELEAFEFSVTDRGTVRSGAPSGTHDDSVVALGLAAWQLQPHRTDMKIWFV